MFGIDKNSLVTKRVADFGGRWNIAVEQQAFSRIYRYGQQRPTLVISITIADTVDDRMQATKALKQQEIREVMTDQWKHKQ